MPCCPRTRRPSFRSAGAKQMAQSLTDPNAANVTPPALLPVVALFADSHNTLHFKFRVLGLSLDDPSVVLVRAYQTGKPLSTYQSP